jgi:hypothetical protein
MKNQNTLNKKSCRKKWKWTRVTGGSFCAVLLLLFTVYLPFFQHLFFVKPTLFLELQSFLHFFYTRILNTSINQTVFNDCYLLDYNFEFSLLCNHLHINLEKHQNFVFFQILPFFSYFTFYSILRKKITPFLDYLTNPLLAYKDILWYFDTLATFFDFVSSKKPLYNSLLPQLPPVFLEFSQILNQKFVLETFFNDKSEGFKILV